MARYILDTKICPERMAAESITTYILPPEISCTALLSHGRYIVAGEKCYEKL